MKDEIEEHYVFLRACENDFTMALKSLTHSEEVDFGYPKFVFIRDAVISYGRPFTSNRGIYKSSRKLTSDMVPSEHMQLHNEVMKLRDTLFAHSDITERNPKLAILGDTKPIFGISSKGMYLTDLIDTLRDMDELIESNKNYLESEKKKLEEIIYNKSTNKGGGGIKF